jgi:hypothetical protein
MGLKKYVGFSILFTVLLGLFVYSFEGGRYTIDVLDVPITLPIALWIVLPVILLALATVAHLMFYGTKNMVTLRRIKKDSQKFTQTAKEALLGKELNSDYKSEVFKLPGAILPLLNADPKKAKRYRIHNDEIQDILDIKEQLENGEVVDLSAYNLNDSNPYMLQNAVNKLENDPDYALTILNRCDDEYVCNKAFDKFVTFGSFGDIRRYEKISSKKTLEQIISRIGASENSLELSNNEIVDYMKEVDKEDAYISEEIVAIMKKLRSKLTPDRLILLADKIAHEFPHRGAEAYLYTMFELQRVDEAREFLDNANEDEYPKFRYLLFLKEQGRNFDTELFV